MDHSADLSAPQPSALAPQQPGGPAGTFRCTAAVIVHNDKSTLWTAAHCLHTGKTGNGYR
ncbi:hypothetical protein [Streptomyces sp. NPDC085540]|uniref:hypothetical protein n=1 Tax=Streptomyces sp. NPDC085540 TaxID=3365730 RepID=UPI0037D46570